jgi:cell pole-organizing protein PopZ
MSSSPDKTDARSMSDILASIRKIMAQDPPSGAPAAVKPPTNGVDGAPRAEMRLPSLEAPRDTTIRESAQPAAPAPAPQSSTAAAASTSSASKPVSGPVPRAPAADEAVSLDEFLAMAAPSRDVVTTPIVPSPPMAPAKPIVSSASTPAASAATPSDISTPDWLFPRARPIDESKGDASREPAFGTAPAGRPGNDAHGPSLVSPQAAGSGISGPIPEAPPSKAPIAGAAVPTGQPPMGARDTEAAPARSAPPPPKMLGDLGSVVPGRFDSRAADMTRRIAEPSDDANDRYSPVGVPAAGPTPVAPSRAEMPRTIPAPDLEPPSEPEIPGADALRRLIAGVVPPSSLVPSTQPRAPAPNADNVTTEIVRPAQARAPDPAAPAAKQAEPAPASKTTVPAPGAIQSDATPAAKPAVAAPIAKEAVSAPATKPPEATPAKLPDPAPNMRAAPVETAPAPAIRPTAPAAGPAPNPANIAAAPPASSSTGTLPTGRTMDETVVELLRPLLRDWLNTNMPRLIEPALKAELEALRGAMSKDKKD